MAARTVFFFCVHTNRLVELHTEARPQTPSTGSPRGAARIHEPPS
jgi:hypothetical protein